MERKKRTKIRRYGNIYGRGMGSGSWQIIVAMVAGVLLFGVIGWSLYTPIHEWMEALGQNPPPVASVAPPVLAPPIAPPASSQESVVAPVEPEPTAGEAFSGIYLPVVALSDPSIVTGFLDRAHVAGLNTVVVEAKDANGTVLFRSNHEIVRQMEGRDVAYDPAVVAKMIQDAGFVPAARLHAFRDSIAPALEREMGVRYYDTEALWFDNAPELGGKPWLNPCSVGAREYLVTLATELVSQGFEVILLDSVQFPSGLGRAKAGYGVIDPDRAAVLSDFIAQMQAAVQGAGGELIVCLPSDVLPTGQEVPDAQLAAENLAVYGGSPAARMTGPTMVTLSNDPAVSRGILDRARAEGPRAVWFGLLPAYRDDGSQIGSTALLAGLDPAGYLLYNPLGNYQLQ